MNQPSVVLSVVFLLAL